MKNVYMTIALAAVIELVSIFLPLKNNGALKKYVSYIISLAVILSVMSAVMGAVRFTGDKQISFEKAYAPNLPKYLYIDTSGAYKTDKSGNKTSESPVTCDLFVKETCLEIAKGIKAELHKKFGVRDEDLKIGVSVDVSDPENIKLTGVTICTNLPDVAKSDLIKYTKELTGAKAVTEEWKN